MKNLTTAFVMILMSVGNSLAQHNKEEIIVSFRLGSCMLEQEFRENAVHLSKIISFLQEAKQDSCLAIVNVEFSGSASPEGGNKLNYLLSHNRMNALEKYICSQVVIPDSIITRKDERIAWQYLDSLVASSDMPYREDVLRVLRNMPELVYKNGRPVDSRQRQLMLLHYGRAWHLMQDRFFDRMRNACAVVITVRKAPDKHPVPILSEEVKENEIIQPDVSAPVQTDETVAEEENVSYRDRPFHMGIKNNMLYDLAFMPNIGVELYLGKNWSVAANWIYAWWKNGYKNRFWRIYGGDIAVRKWLGKAAEEKPLTGHHLGLYAQMLTYDFELGGRGYISDRWNYVGGVEYGYSLPIVKRLNFDFVIGIGYMGGRYKKYVPIDNHYVWQKTKEGRWFGPTKAEVSLVWLIGRGNRNEKKGGQ